MEHAPGHGRTATGLVLLVLVGRRAWSARRARAPTPLPTAGSTRSPIGAGPRAFPAPRSRGEHGPRSAVPRPSPRTPASRSRPTRASPRSETLLSYDRAYSGYAPIMGTPWLTAFAQRSRFAEAFQSSAKGQSDTGKFRAELNALPREEWPSTIRRLVSDQISLLLASHHRSGPAAVRIWSGFAGQLGAAHPDRNRDGGAHQPHAHHHGPRLGGAPVRSAGNHGGCIGSLLMASCRGRFQSRRERCASGRW